MSKQADTYQRLKPGYEKRAYRKLKKAFRRILKGIDFTSLDFGTAAATIALNINDQKLMKAMQEMYLDIGGRYGKHVMRDIGRIEERKAEVPYPLFGEAFQRFVTNYFRSKGGKLIETLNNTMAKSVLEVIAQAQEQGLTRSEMITNVQQTVNKRDFYRWQSMRIARTETTFAMNASKQTAIKESGLKMQKEWVHGHPSSPRQDHLAIDGQKVGMNEKFILPDGIEMDYPGDKDGGAKHTINCTCTYVYRPQRDSDGRLIRAA